MGVEISKNDLDSGSFNSFRFVRCLRSSQGKALLNVWKREEFPFFLRPISGNGTSFNSETFLGLEGSMSGYCIYLEIYYGNSNQIN